MVGRMPNPEAGDALGARRAEQRAPGIMIDRHGNKMGDVRPGRIGGRYDSSRDQPHSERHDEPRHALRRGPVWWLTLLAFALLLTGLAMHVWA